MMSSFIKDAFTSSFSSKIGYLFARKSFKVLKDKMDYKKVGGAFLLGVNTIAVKAHGNSDETSFLGSLNIAYDLASKNFLATLKENLK